jgi:hypothetical protein
MSSKIKTSLQKKDFLLYADSETKTIQEEGMERMGTTLGINIYTDMFITFFFYKCGCKVLEEVTEDEYVRGLSAFNCNTLNEVKNRIEGVREILLNIESSEFRKFYVFLYTFNYIKKLKMIPIDVVEVYFNNLFECFPLTKRLINYFKNVIKCQGLTKDQWECALDFFINHGSSFPQHYNVDEYYPVLFDDFYNWYLDNGNK